MKNIVKFLSNLNIFNILYTFLEDPWNYKNSQYEKTKYNNTLSILPPKKFKRILEVGCSEGIFTSKLAPLADEIFGVDISSIAIKRAKIHNKTFSNIKFLVANLEEINFKKKFDLIICSEVLYYFDNKKIKIIRDKFISWLMPQSYIILTHMRNLCDDSSGFKPSIIKYPSKGAYTVHEIFNKKKSLKIVKEITKPKYRISLFRKTI